MVDESYNCFQFNEKSLFDQYVGTAFKEDIEYDIKINNGLNSNNSEVKRIKVIKIEGVYYQPVNKIPPDYLVEGKSVEIKYCIVNRDSICMIGPLIYLQSITEN